MTDADPTDNNNPLNSGKAVSDAEETSVMKAVSDSGIAASQEDTAASHKQADANQASASEYNSAPGTPDEYDEEEKPKSGIRKFFGIMPFWAWVLTLGLIAAIIVAAVAFTTMRSTETGAPGSTTNTEQLKPSYPKPTTTGKYDDDDTTPTPDAGPGYGGGYQDYYAPQQPVQTEQETSTEESESSSPSSNPQPSRPEREGNRPAPNSNRGNGQPGAGTTRPGGGIGGNAGGASDAGTGAGAGAGADDADDAAEAGDD